MTASLNHLNIAQIHGIEEAEGTREVMSAKVALTPEIDPYIGFPYVELRARPRQRIYDG